MLFLMMHDIMWVLDLMYVSQIQVTDVMLCKILKGYKTDLMYSDTVVKILNIYSLLNLFFLDSDIKVN